ncbi:MULTISPECIES: hypothetical protein [unclassified Methylobacterium]|uniref:hypothetical protein n=1 Tax=unclassified Methylobacterium TaxID=2615210 RepID=UPI002269BBD0|nr:MULTISPECIES: hypothetical protein [unclassified Methylobacterium]
MGTFWVWLILTAGLPAVVALVVVVLGFGPALATLLANSKIARGAGMLAAFVWALLVAAARIRSSARDEALESVQRANAAAREDRERIEKDVSQLDDRELTRELQRWSR